MRTAPRSSGSATHTGIFVSERWDEANKPGWTSQFRGIVDRRVAQGFTVYQANLMATATQGHELGGTPRYWRRPFDELNVSFFQDVVDPRMAYLAESGLVTALGLGWYPLVDTDLEGVKHFARYVVARYGAYPMVWTLGGEVAGYEPELRQSRIDRWREVALTIRDVDGYQHPITAHAAAERPIAPYCQDEDWLTLTLNQHGHGDFDLSTSHYGEHLAAYPGRPLVEGESLYEGLHTLESAGRRQVTDTMVRQAAYRAVQSGCCGYTYGAQGCWNAAWEPGHHASMWGDVPWYESVDLTGAEQLGYMRRFYENVGWARLRPADSCFRASLALNNDAYAPRVTADEKMSTVILHFGEAFLTGLPDLPYAMHWFDPRTGTCSVAGNGRRPVAGELALAARPDGRDWLLVVQGEAG